MSFERDQLRRDLRASVARRDALEQQVGELATEAARARRRAEAAERAAEQAAMRVAVLERELGDAARAAHRWRLADERAAQRGREHQAQAAEVAEARAELASRTAQVLQLHDARWYRIAATTWRIRRRRAWAATVAVALGAAAAAALALALLPDLRPFAAVVFPAAAVVVYVVAARASTERRADEDRWRGRIAASAAPDGTTPPRDERGVERVLVPAAPRTAAAVPPLAAAALPPRGAASMPALAAAALPPRGAAAMPPLAATAPPRAADASPPGNERRVLVPAPPRATATAPLGAACELRELRVAGILDGTLRAGLEPECDLVHVPFEGWRDTLEERPPHLLLVESAVRGNGGAWEHAVASFADGPDPELCRLRELVAWCRERGIPTAFWDTADPAAAERFGAAASLFDHVFTVDPERAGTLLAPAAQPAIHNPVAAGRPANASPAHIGRFDRRWSEQRRAGLELLLDAARPFGLVIYDQGRGDESGDLGFPERFAPQVRARLRPAEVAAAYKRHPLFVAPTESARVFELLACGTPVIAPPSPLLEALMGDVVAMPRSAAEAAEQLDRLLHDEAHRRAVADHGLRRVMAEHTYEHRLAAIARTVGFELPPAAGTTPAVLVVVDGDTGALDRNPGALEGDARALGRNPGAIEGDARALGRNTGAIEGDARALGRNTGAIEGDARALGRNTGAIEGDARAPGRDAGALDRDRGVLRGDAGALEALVADLADQTIAVREVLVGAPDAAPLDVPLQRLRHALPQAQVRRVRQERGRPFADRARELAALASSTWVAPLLPGHRYAPDHLERIALCSRFAQADVIGYGTAAAHTYAAALEPPTAAATRDVVARLGWPTTADGLSEWFRRGIRLYCAGTAPARVPVGAPGRRFVRGSARDRVTGA